MLRFLSSILSILIALPLFAGGTKYEVTKFDINGGSPNIEFKVGHHDTYKFTDDDGYASSILLSRMLAQTFDHSSEDDSEIKTRKWKPLRAATIGALDKLIASYEKKGICKGTASIPNAPAEKQKYVCKKLKKAKMGLDQANPNAQDAREYSSALRMGRSIGHAYPMVKSSTAPKSYGYKPSSSGSPKRNFPFEIFYGIPSMREGGMRMRTRCRTTRLISDEVKTNMLAANFSATELGNGKSSAEKGKKL